VGTRRVGATYRVQVRPGFDLHHTAALAGYLADLGASHLYSAPLLAAVPGSSHGYNVADPTRVNPELGGAEGLAGLVATLRGRGLGLVVDIVPNHVGVELPRANPAWWSVLREGPGSPYAAWFDIDWSRGRVVLPVLADEADALDRLDLTGDELCYYEHRFPVAPGTGGGSPREVHDRQHYELVSWRRGNQEVSYRRFFAVSELAALRVEDPEVFAATHAELLRWYQAGLIDGVRVDHPDGLADPAGYLARLHAALPQAWLVVEKILEAGEELPAWPVCGTTGYEALREVCGVFIDQAGEAGFGAADRWPELAHQGRYQAATVLLRAELGRLSRLAPELPGAAAALAELAARFPVYRSYLPAGAEHLEQALARAGDLVPPALAARLRDPADELAVRFQQFTGAVMAKGVEDTACYRFNRFIALNEVGGAPDRFGVSPAEFHRAAADRQARYPAAMTTLSTHDTKRAEDVRARLAVLAELPEEWHAAQARWSAYAPVPDPDLADLLWQTVAGAWPIERERLHAYLEKAAREAGTRTTWDAPDPAFEAAVHAAIDAVYDLAELRGDVAAFVAGITPPGWSNALGQKLVQLTMPGVPDVYQGTELWDNSLVDPDNRRPVEFAARAAVLAQLDAGQRPPVDESGAAKLLVVSRALRARRDHPDAFGGYRPVAAQGAAAGHALAFDRGGALTVATRLPVRLHRRGGWGDTWLPVPPGRWRDALSGRYHEGPRVGLAALLQPYPVALLVGWDD
jgi:(1->4)-alpha-D-glucan 1-alpha-D-glucosylmutase